MTAFSTGCAPTVVGHGTAFLLVIGDMTEQNNTSRSSGMYIGIGNAAIAAYHQQEARQAEADIIRLSVILGGIYRKLREENLRARQRIQTIELNGNKL